MKKRFIIATNNTTDEQNKRFVEILGQKQGLGWWHWLQNNWLLATDSNDWTAAKVRDEVTNAFPGVHAIVFELAENEGTWSGFGPNTQDRDMFKWIKDNWK